MKKLTKTAIILLAAAGLAAALYSFRGSLIDILEARITQGLENAFGAELEYEAVEKRENSLIVSGLEGSASQFNFSAGKAVVDYSLFENGFLSPSIEKITAEKVMIYKPGSAETDPQNAYPRFVNFIENISSHPFYSIFKSGSFPDLETGRVAIKSPDKGDIILSSLKLSSKGSDNTYKIMLNTPAGAAFGASFLNAEIKAGKRGFIRVAGNLNASLFGSEWMTKDLSLDASWKPSRPVRFKFNASTSKTEIEAEGSADLSKKNAPYRLSLKTENILLSSITKVNAVYENEKLYSFIGKGTTTFLKEFNPEGRMDSEVKLWGSLSQKPKMRGEIRPQKMTASYVFFPYEVKVSGKIDLSSEKYRFDLKCTHKDQEAKITGWHDIKCTSLPDYPNCDIIIHSNEAYINHDVYKSLDARLKKIWNMINPSGEMAFTYQYLRNEKGKRYLIDINLKNAQAELSKFPLPASSITGDINVNPEEITLTDIRGTAGDSNFNISGTIENALLNEPDYDLEVFAKGLTLDSVLISSLPKDPARMLDDFYIDAQSTLTLELSKENRENDWNLDADISGNEIVYKPSMLTITDPQMKIRAGKGSWRAEMIKAEIAGGSFTAKAGGEIVNKSLGGFEGELSCENLEAGRCLELLGEDYKSFLKGKLGIDADFSSGQDKPLQITALAELQNNTAEIDGLKLEDVSGTVDIKAGTNKPAAFNYSVSGKSVDLPEASIKADGRVKYEEGKLDSLNNITAESVNLSNAEFKDLSGFSGKADFRLEGLEFSSEKEDIDIENFRLEFKDLSTGWIKEAHSAEGNLTGSCNLSKNLELQKAQADLYCSRLLYKGAAFKEVSQSFNYSLGAISSPEKGSASLYGGAASFNYRLMPSGDAPPAYDFSLDLNNVNISELLNDTVEEKNGRLALSGMLSSQLSVEGVAGRQEFRKGRLDIVLKNSQITSKNLISRIVSAVFSRQPAEKRIKTGLISGYIIKDRLVISDAVIQLESLKLQGAGEMNLENQKLDLSLQVFMFEDETLRGKLLNTIGKLIAEVQVKGPLSEPSIKTRTFGIPH
ncbi:putative assembly protein [Sedimentisphaera salicampi]|uniref:Putative assembly protein n=1 Tax=Sedimentisphaera salicampi TaxID=1941349 RepID=A0A1W6LPX4_9BACT|nr:putative assembly protein [Sedimentisphaera salicampi]